MVAGCPRCGMPGRHADTAECIDALRGRIADLEFRQELAVDNRRAPRAERRGGRRDRSDARMVLLDGQRLTLAQAAEKLALTEQALYFRIRRQVGTNYRDVDLRTLGLDGRLTPCAS